MKIVTYNVNGLRSRISQFGSLRKLLDSLDADIICFQEIKLSRQELTADLAMANGYESFFSCTRTFVKGRVSYSGVATFCRVNSAFFSNEVALPTAAEEGITGLMENHNTKKGETPRKAEGLDEFEKDELLKLDCEGRCVITDHGQFVIFNIYGPRAECDDIERTQFKISFFKILQKRCEALICHGRRIFIVGDLNISPSAIDSCRAGPDFENNECRKWLKSVLVECGGPFFDVFRAKHPARRDAYTCWPQHTGAEEFNYGSRIDHILCTGKCFHQIHDFIACHVKECDIIEKFKRWKPGETPRWKGGRSAKLEGSDHIPVYVCLIDIPSVAEHSTPSLSTRYIPKLHGCQQTIVSLLMKRQGGDHLSAGGGGGDAQKSEQDPSSQRDLPALKKTRPNQSLHQLSLRSFFKKKPSPTAGTCISDENPNNTHEAGVGDGGKLGKGVALEEWRRIREAMQSSIPLCEGHREACVPRTVKKAGPNCGRTFYVCARAEGPESNPEANCNHFKWAAAPKCRRRG